ncbi:MULTISPECIES: CHAT domain-containing protein [Aphanothece]|uniref:CHAT domain-containing protein n=1 Tax=Aphanothece TaxID=1121 RepID=UPI003984DCAB
MALIALVQPWPAGARELQPSEGAETGFRASDYNPAILSLSFSAPANEPGGQQQGGEPTSEEKSQDAFLDLVLVTQTGEPFGRRVAVRKGELQEDLKLFYRQLARQEDLNAEDPASPTRRLFSVMLGPLAEELERQKITTLVIAAERGLQAVPFAALHDGKQYMGERFAFSITPSLQLTSLAPPSQKRGRMMAAGASKFTDLAPLPLVTQELNGLENRGGVERFLNQEFTPKLLLDQAVQDKYQYVHVATHAEFLPGGPDKARIYAGTGSISLNSFADLRQRRKDDPIELFALSACRTALGDQDSELGFAGLALQAGARSAIGSLWYVDDVATSAFFLQFYRYLNAGLPKAEAMQATRKALIEGTLHRDADKIFAADGSVLLTDLTTEQQQRVAKGLEHPFFWSGIELLGVPW